MARKPTTDGRRATRRAKLLNDIFSPTPQEIERDLANGRVILPDESHPIGRAESILRAEIRRQIDASLVLLASAHDISITVPQQCAVCGFHDDSRCKPRHAALAKDDPEAFEKATDEIRAAPSEYDRLRFSRHVHMLEILTVRSAISDMVSGFARAFAAAALEDVYGIPVTPQDEEAILSDATRTLSMLIRHTKGRPVVAVVAQELDRAELLREYHSLPARYTTPRKHQELAKKHDVPAYRIKQLLTEARSIVGQPGRKKLVAIR